MKKGQRTRTPNLCACGCGKFAPILYCESGPRKGHVRRYADFIIGHGNKDWGRRQKAMPVGWNDRRSIGSTRLHYSNPTLVYRMIKVGPGGKSNWRFEHRVVVERHIGRRLDRKEHVHHKNGDTLDNRVENLELLSHSDHSKHHSELHRWSKKFDRCQECGTVQHYHVGKGLCYRCFQRAAARANGGWPKRY